MAGRSSGAWTQMCRAATLMSTLSAKRLQVLAITTPLRACPARKLTDSFRAWCAGATSVGYGGCLDWAAGGRSHFDVLQGATLLSGWLAATAIKLLAPAQCFKLLQRPQQQTPAVCPAGTGGHPAGSAAGPCWERGACWRPNCQRPVALAAQASGGQRAATSAAWTGWQQQPACRRQGACSQSGVVADQVHTPQWGTAAA